MNMMSKSTMICITGVTALIAVSMVAICVGRVQISFDALFNIIIGNRDQYMTEWNVMTSLHIPRTLAAILVGMGLSVSGLLYQELFQNKLVSPDFLGVSEGAGIGAAIAILAGLSSIFISGFAFVTGIVAVMTAMAISSCFRNRSSFSLLLSGLIVGGMTASILSFIKYIVGPETTLAEIEFWLMGSCQNVTMEQIIPLIAIVITCLTVVMMIKWRVNLISLGKEECTSRGLSYKKYGILIIVLSTLMTAATVAVVGCVSWIGLVIPHIARVIIGQNTKYTIPTTMLIGGAFMVVADIISRCFNDSEIPLSAVTGFFGTIFFVIILMSKRGKIDERI